jgi:hypothetical protein
MAGGEEEININGYESGDDALFGPRETAAQRRKTQHKEAAAAANAATAIATAQRAAALVTERPMTAAEAIALERRRYANSIQAATPALPDIYTGDTIVNNKSTAKATADNLGQYLKNLREGMHPRDFSKRNKSIQQLIRHNKSGSQVKIQSIHNRWRKEINRIIGRIKNYLEKPSHIGNIYHTTKDLLREKCTNNDCLVIEFNINDNNGELHEFHITFHNIYNPQSPISRSGAFHIVYQESNGDRRNYYIYRFVPYIDGASSNTIKLQLTIGPHMNNIRVPREVMDHIRNIAGIVQNVFSYTLNPKADNPLRAFLRGGSNRTVRRNRSKRRGTAKLLRR